MDFDKYQEEIDKAKKEYIEAIEAGLTARVGIIEKELEKFEAIQGEILEYFNKCYDLGLDDSNNDYRSAMFFYDVFRDFIDAIDNGVNLLKGDSGLKKFNSYDSFEALTFGYERFMERCASMEKLAEMANNHLDNGYQKAMASLRKITNTPEEEDAVKKEEN